MAEFNTDDLENLELEMDTNKSIEKDAKEDKQVDDVFFRAIVNCVDFYGNDDSIDASIWSSKWGFDFTLADRVLYIYVNKQKNEKYMLFGRSKFKVFQCSWEIW